MEPLITCAFGLSRPCSTNELDEPDTTTACFVAGTLVATPRGPVRVERLCEGDFVIANVDRVQPILRIRKQRLSLVQHPFPQAVSPIRIAPHALAEGLPQHALYLSPDHAIFIDDMVIGAASLVNGTTITQADIGRCTYYHLDLIRGESGRAKRPPAATELTDDDRKVIVMHPDLRDLDAQIGLLWPSPVSSYEQISVVVARSGRRAKMLGYTADRLKEGSIRMLWRFIMP